MREVSAGDNRRKSSTSLAPGPRIPPGTTLRALVDDVTRFGATKCFRAHRMLISVMAGLLVDALISACGSISVYVDGSSPHSKATAAYRKVWAGDWKTINEASEPWNGTGSKPGVCDKGGTRSECYETDRAVMAGLAQLISDLQDRPVPKTYADANQAMLIALAKEVRGLEDRNLGLISAEHEDAFTRSLTELHDAAVEMVAAYGNFPDDDRPDPALFGVGRHFS